MRYLDYNDSGAENPEGMLGGDRLDLDAGDRVCFLLKYFTVFKAVSMSGVQ